MDNDKKILASAVVSINMMTIGKFGLIKYYAECLMICGAPLLMLALLCCHVIDPSILEQIKLSSVLWAYAAFLVLCVILAFLPDKSNVRAIRTVELAYRCNVARHIYTRSVQLIDYYIVLRHKLLKQFKRF